MNGMTCKLTPHSVDKVDGMGDDNDGHTVNAADMTLAALEEQADAAIRRALISGTWYFSVIDVVAVLTGSDAPRKYWVAMKRRISDEGFVEASTKCRQLKLLAADGKLRATEAADVETLLRLIQSIPSPKAEPIKQWLAKVGAERLQERMEPAAPPLSLGSAIAEVWRNQPEQDADPMVWAEYLEQLAGLYRRQARVESRLRVVEAASVDHEEQLESLQSRMESVEEWQRMLPELLEKLGRRLTTERQDRVKP